MVLPNANNNNVINIGIHKFDPTKINMLERHVIFAGKRATGKKTVIRDLLYKQYMYYGSPTRALFSFYKSSSSMKATDHTFYDDNINIECRTFEFDPEKHFGELIDLQWEEFRKNNALVVLHDAMTDKISLRSDNFRKVAMHGHLHRIGLWNSVRYCMDLGTDLRSSVDYVFAFHDSSHVTRKRLWKAYFNIFPTYEQFSEAFDACTSNYECMVIDLQAAAKSGKIEHCVFWYRADPNLPHFFLKSQPVPSMQS
jgi:hypothetical protein